MIAYGPVKIQKNNYHKNNYDNNYDNNDKSLSGKENKLNKNSLIISSNVKNEKTVNEKIPSSSTDKKLKISILKFISKMCEITGKFGGFLQNYVSVCVWHLFPLLAEIEVRA